MPGDAQPRVDVAGVMPVNKAKRPPQPILVAGNCDDMHVIGHQAVGPNLDTRPVGCVGKKIEIERIVRLLEKSPLTTVAALRDMMRFAGEDEAGKPSHDTKLCPLRNRINIWGLLHVSP